MNIIAIDIGGTNVRISTFTYNDRVLERSGEIDRHDVWQGTKNISPKELADLVKRYSEERRISNKVDAVGCAIAGMLDAKRTTVEKALNVGWEDVPLKSILEEATRSPVLLDTDAYAGAYYEAREGIANARGFSTFLYVAIGTGIGHALVQNGKIWRGAQNRSNVFGHLTYVPNGRECYCGSRGCVCRYAAGPGIVESAVGYGFQKIDIPRDRLHGSDIVHAARAGDPHAVEALESATDALAVALSHAYNLLDHGYTVLAGGAVGTYWPDLDDTRRAIVQNVHPSIEHIDLVKSQDPGTGILHGIAAQTAVCFEEGKL